MTYDQIITEVEARGFHHIDSTRIGRWVNKRYRRVNASQPWTFLETTASGAPPLTISDLRAVLSVVDTIAEEPIYFEDVRTILENDPNLETTGSAAYWYIEGSTIAVWPVSTDAISVRYLNRPADLTTGQSPVWPSEYHYILVEGAVADAYRNTDNFEAAGTIEQEIANDVASMGEDLLVTNYDTPRDMLMTGSTDW